MPIDPSYVGRVYPATRPYLVSREKVREFAYAIDDHNPASHDQAAARMLGYADVVAPPTFAVVLTLPAGEQVTADPDLGLDYTRVVHSEQHFVHHRPLVAGDEVSVVVSVTSIRSMAGNDVLGISADVTTTAGEPVLQATSTLVSRGAGSQ